MEGWVDLSYPAMHRPGVELAISRSQVRRPNHNPTEPPDNTLLPYRAPVLSLVLELCIEVYSSQINWNSRNIYSLKDMLCEIDRRYKIKNELQPPRSASTSVSLHLFILDSVPVPMQPALSSSTPYTRSIKITDKYFGSSVEIHVRGYTENFKIANYNITMSSSYRTEP